MIVVCSLLCVLRRFCDVQVGLFARLFGHVPNAPRAGLERGRTMLQRFGFLRRAADPQHVGIMHQLVQKAVRQHIMAPASACGVPHCWVPRLVQTAEAVLCAGFAYDEVGINDNQGRKQWLRMLSSCVERWCANWCVEQFQCPAAT